MAIRGGITRDKLFVMEMTIEDAKHIWHKLNINSEQSFSDYCKKYKKAGDVDTFRLWNYLDEILKREEIPIGEQEC